jgi:gas vesicle protein GvpL/GvpF
MAWYVFALLDRPPSRRAGKGLAAPITVREFAGCLVAAERRADVPPVELGALNRHHAVVARLWNDTPAVLPVRFGTLLASGEIAEALEDKDEELAEAFDLVRGRAQFSWRARLRPRASTAARTIQRPEPMSGTEYLRRAARASTPPPRRFASIRQRLKPLITVERYEPSRARLPETLYHLVDRTRIDPYLAAAARISRAASAGPTLSGPFPPYAFVPEILG